jgi:NADH-quinone oxidoreductase subunit L
LQVIAAVGSATAVFAALIAVAQNDIKRILAYSTVSQLGYMFLGLATGGVAVGMFHLITHAFFKALLFLGSGSVIHGCQEEQDIRRMGGLRRLMPVTFLTYAVGMMALSGVPLVFSGFWSKDEILHAAWLWQPSRWPFVLGVFGAFLTAFYMTRQVAEVFFGEYRGAAAGVGHGGARKHDHDHDHDHDHHPAHGGGAVHESPRVMTVPLMLLAVCAVLLGVIGTPAWPWFEAYLAGHEAVFDVSRFTHAIPLMTLSAVVVALGMGLGWALYGRRPRKESLAPDVLASRFGGLYRALGRRLYVDEIYEATVVAGHRIGSALVDWADRLVVGGLVTAVGAITQALAFVLRWVDELFVNAGFDAGCATTGWVGRGFSRFQNGRGQRYLMGMVLGTVVLAGVVIWGMNNG